MILENQERTFLSYPKLRFIGSEWYINRPNIEEVRNPKGREKKKFGGMMLQGLRILKSVMRSGKK